MGSVEPESSPFAHWRAIDETRSIRVGIIGGGVSGIGQYIRLKQYVPEAVITIFEKNPSLGGTWYENKYPGVACDIPSHTYQYTYEPNTQWSKFFSGGPEILDYVNGVADKYKVQNSVQVGSKVVHAAWDEAQGIWDVKVQQDDSEESKSHQFEILISCTGILNNWRWPSIPGLHDFQGPLLHSANWDTTFDWANKEVALIGAGSSAIQILPHLQKTASKVYNFARTGTYLSEPFGGSTTTAAIATNPESGNHEYTAAELKKFQDDPDYYWSYRKEIEASINADYPCLFPGSPDQVEGTRRIKAHMAKKLASKPEILKGLHSDFLPGCRRLTPGPGYLEALVQDNVHFTNDPIVKVTADSIITASGVTRKVDAIACATGFDSSFMPRFPTIGKGGVDLKHKWESIGHASAYLSHSIPNFPNYFMVAGPNSLTGGGSSLIQLESIISYVTKCVAKIHRENLKSMSVRDSSLTSWERFMDKHWPRTVHVGNCSSWYKVNGKISGLWPGSSNHVVKTLENPRWEDYEYERKDGEESFDWLGDGWTMADKTRTNLGGYLDHVDFPPAPS